MKLSDIKLGIYEKALPADLDWTQKLMTAENLGFNFVEISIDESDSRLARLDWNPEKRRDFQVTIANSPLTVPSMCFSGHRRFPLGSHDPEKRKISRDLMKKAIFLATDLGIRTIQLAGYDVYYEKGDQDTQHWFIEGIMESLELAARENVMLSMEIMDTLFMSSIVRFLNLRKKLNSPWFTVYPDIGNLSAWGNDVDQELSLGIEYITAIHLKDTLAVTPDFPGQFRDISFGEGCVDFISVFETLNKLKFRGPLLMEMWTEKSSNPIKIINDARLWMIDKMRKGEFCD